MKPKFICKHQFIVDGRPGVQCSAFALCGAIMSCNADPDTISKDGKSIKMRISGMICYEFEPIKGKKNAVDDHRSKGS